MTDRARPGLVALYDIRPGNGAGQFLQPRSPHGAKLVDTHRILFASDITKVINWQFMFNYKFF